MADQQGLKFDFDPVSYRAAKLAVVGVGGAGGNAVGSMIESNVENVVHMICNTDVQALERSKVPVQIQLGDKLTRGLGAGGDPNVGMAAAEESLEVIEEYIRDVDMLFVTAGMGGGTGTGAAAVVARKAMDMGILTVGVVTRPFRFEGPNREKLANQGIQALKESVNTLIVIPNQRLLDLEEADLSILQTFKKADEVLVNAVRGISDLITTAGYVNVDFADVRSIMSNMGMAIMGTGSAVGEERAVEAARAAISSPLLDDLDINGAKGVLVNITGSSTLSLREVDEAVGYIQETADPDANFIFGYVIDEAVGDSVNVTVIATGFPDKDGTNVERDSRIARRKAFQGNLDIPAHIRNSSERTHEGSRVLSATPVRRRPQPVELADELDLTTEVMEVETANTKATTTEKASFPEPSSIMSQFVEPSVSEEQISIPSFRRRQIMRRER